MTAKPVLHRSLHCPPHLGHPIRQPLAKCGYVNLNCINKILVQFFIHSSHFSSAQQPYFVITMLSSTNIEYFPHHRKFCRAAPQRLRIDFPLHTGRGSVFASFSPSCTSPDLKDPSCRCCYDELQGNKPHVRTLGVGAVCYQFFSSHPLIAVFYCQFFQFKQIYILKLKRRRGSWPCN